MILVGRGEAPSKVMFNHQSKISASKRYRRRWPEWTYKD